MSYTNIRPQLALRPTYTAVEITLTNYTWASPLALFNCPCCFRNHCPLLPRLPLNLDCLIASPSPALSRSNCSHPQFHAVSPFYTLQVFVHLRAHTCHHLAAKSALSTDAFRGVKRKERGTRRVLAGLSLDNSRRAYTGL